MLKRLAVLLCLLIIVFWWTTDAPHRYPAVPLCVSVPDSQAGNLVVDLVDNCTTHDIDDINKLTGGSFRYVHETTRDECLLIGSVESQYDAWLALRDNPLVEVAEPELTYHMDAYPNDPLYKYQWNMRMIGVPSAWRNTPQGQGITVAVVDTGVAGWVEDLQGTRILPGKSFVTDEPTSEDFNGHGTHVAGTIAQTTNNSLGVIGIAPKASILPVKVLNAGGFGSSASVAAGILWAVENGADVINLSLGGGYSEVIHNAVRKAKQSGAIVVAARGNTGNTVPHYPGAHEEVIGVSAIGPDAQLAPYSSYGQGTDIAAPGGNKDFERGGILQNTVDGKGGQLYAQFQGTSMAAPHVAGAAAVLLSTGMDPGAVEKTLLTTADGDIWTEEFGWGKLNLARAVSVASTRYPLARGGIALVLSLLILTLGRTRLGFKFWAALLSVLTASGLFFLHWLPLPDFTLVRMLSVSVIQWPTFFVDQARANQFLWLSALPSLGATLLCGPHRSARPAITGLALGTAAYFLHAAVTGCTQLFLLWFELGSVPTAIWYAVNTIVALLLAMALVGTETLDEEGNS